MLMFRIKACNRPFSGMCMWRGRSVQSTVCGCRLLCQSVLISLLSPLSSACLLSSGRWHRGTAPAGSSLSSRSPLPAAPSPWPSPRMTRLSSVGSQKNTTKSVLLRELEPFNCIALSMVNLFTSSNARLLPSFHQLWSQNLTSMWS